MFEVILGKQQITIDLPYDYLVSIKFPIHWDSTTLEQFIPDLTDYIGYDVPLSARFRNMGAPRFIFSREEMKIKYNCEVEVWNDDFSDYIMTIKYFDVEIDFDMWLEGMTINTEWNSIKMGHAEVKSDVVDNLERVHADKRVTRFFNMAWRMIIPWVNEMRPYGVAEIPIPENLHDLILIRDLKMAVRDNYFSFTLDP